MRAIIGIVFAVLAGCYGPHAPFGAPCDPIAPRCPGDQVCSALSGGFACLPAGTLDVDARVGDAPADDGPITDGSLADATLVDARLVDAPVADARLVDGPLADAAPDANPDIDGDGVPNATDNCPTVPNPGQENEDGDRFGDACDSCPAYAHDNPSDPDGDGVSDECDPRPNTPGDAIVLFEGFHAGVPPGWTTGGMWTAANDAVSVGQSLRSYLSTTITSTQHETISAGLTVDSLDNSGTDAAAGVVDNFNRAATRSGVFCHVMRQETPAGTPIAVADLNTHVMTTPFELVVGAPYVVALRRDASQYTCTGAHGPVTASVATTAATTITPDGIGIRANHAGTSVRWVMVVANP